MEAGGLVRSGEERRHAIEFATEQELSQILSKMTGIEWAAVLYSSKTKPGLRPQDEATASVTVKPLGNQSLKRELASGIRRMVAASFAGLEEKDVKVWDHNTGFVFDGDPEDPAASMGEGYIARQRSLEHHLEEDIRSLLAHIGGLRVQATVILDNEWQLHEQKIQHDPKTVPAQISETDTRRTVESKTPAGPVGARSQENSSMRLSSTDVAGPNEEETKTQSQTINAISSTRTEKHSIGPIIDRATVALAVPASYFQNIWLEQNPPDPEADADAEPGKPDQGELAQIQTQELATIREQVAILLPETEGVEDKTELVHVSVYLDSKPEELPKPGLIGRCVDWLSRHWTTIGLIALLAGTLVVLRGMFRAAAIAEPGIDPAVLAVGETPGEAGAAKETAAARRLRRFEGGGASLRDELSELVDEDPDAAANILRAWIGNTT
jgi:flagellar M-ring protein FliF